jgi:hypothetical protein
MPKNKTTVEAPLQTLSSRAEPSDLRFHLTRSQALPPTSPLSPIVLPPRKPPNLMSLYSLLLQTWEFPSLSKTPLSTPAEPLIRKRTQKYQIL